MNGTYLTIILQIDEDVAIDQLMKIQGQAVIASTMFPHELKVSTMHFKIRRSYENNEIVPSKSLMEFSCGFRRIVIKPTFSMELNAQKNGDKLKYMRFLRKD